MQPLSVTLIQSDIHWEDIELNLSMFGKKIDSIHEKTQVIVLPEMFSTGFTMKPEGLAETMDGRTVQWMKAMSKEKNAVITGSIIIKEDNHFFNRLIWMLPTGNFGYYDKRHLFSFAGEDVPYRSGDKKLIGSLSGWKINLQVCYDLRFPVWSRQDTDPEKQYDLYINVANWPDKRSDAWRTLLGARAIENQCYVVGVNRVGTDGNGHHYDGFSSVIDPLGKVLWTKENQEAVYTHTFQEEEIAEVRSHFPFLNDADNYNLLL
ncbi:MAG: amidohydrolase [Chitinophagaceae bacterium]|nr:amidohydrolase [Chitinophagaceae bacterium]